MLVGTFKNDNEKSTLLTSYRLESSSILVTSNICRIGGQKDRIEFKLKKNNIMKKLLLPNIFLIKTSTRMGR